MPKVATIGYEGARPEALDAALKAAGVSLVVDVRAVAISRRAGFSKTALRDRLLGQDIGYLHLRALGDPKPGREAARSGDMPLFRKIFAQHMQTPEAKAQLLQLQQLVGSRDVALLCYEADASGCHRSIIAQQLAESSELSIVHLTVDRGGATTIGRTRALDHTCEGLATA